MATSVLLVLLWTAITPLWPSALIRCAGCYKQKPRMTMEAAATAGSLWSSRTSRTHRSAQPSATALLPLYSGCAVLYVYPYDAYLLLTYTTLGGDDYW